MIFLDISILDLYKIVIFTTAFSIVVALLIIWNFNFVRNKLNK